MNASLDEVGSDGKNNEEDFAADYRYMSNTGKPFEDTPNRTTPKTGP
jgi:hypothetical protein